jgi:hypothetical protein
MSLRADCVSDLTVVPPRGSVVYLTTEGSIPTFEFRPDLPLVTHV